MRLSKTAYYADFAVYGAVLTAMIVIAALGPGWTQRVQWLLACAAGVACWTLIEYLLHCLILHGHSTLASIFAPMHAVHHESPRAYVGTPTWITLAVFWLAFFVPAWACSSLNVASGLTAGVMMGWVWYGVVHHVIHFRQPRALVRWVSAAARRHMYHHYSTQPGNFGVTIPLWDHVFGTVIEQTRRPIARSPARVPPAT
jgi:sterol desaturase/sphingolipid hydroxylase (fatty acid hydroxylase superfamily)